jgi:hypothetical protein
VRKAIAEANAARPPRRRGPRDPKAAFQSHLDKLLDLIAGVEDLDNRRAMIEQVTVSAAKLMPDEPPPGADAVPDVAEEYARLQKAKRSARNAKAKARRNRAKAEAPANGLDWKPTGFKGRDGREAFTAKAGRGRYDVSPAIGGSKSYYVAEHVVSRKSRTVTPRSASASEAVVTPDEAKLFAQRDWQRGGADERTRKEPQPIGISIPL